MILVITPLPMELEALRGALGPSSRVKLELGGHGKVHFALRTQSLAAQHKPQLVICAGACGSLSSDVRARDVIVATQTLEHDFKVRFMQRPAPLFDGDPMQISHLQKSWQTRHADFAVHFGIMASGDEDIIERERALELRRQTGALAVAWEGAGGARACNLAHIPYLEIRGVTDMADSSAGHSFKENLLAAMANVAKVIGVL